MKNSESREERKKFFKNLSSKERKILIRRNFNFRIDQREAG